MFEKKQTHKSSSKISYSIAWRRLMSIISIIQTLYAQSYILNSNYLVMGVLNYIFIYKKNPLLVFGTAMFLCSCLTALTPVITYAKLSTM